MVDITDRKRAEEALRESTLRYERVTMASNAGLWDWDVEKDEYYVLTALSRDVRLSRRHDVLRAHGFHAPRPVSTRRTMSGGCRRCNSCSRAAIHT
jgi:PAS domain-containing protein